MQASGLDQRLRAARQRAFVGRHAEVELFRTALTQDEPPFAVLHVHGPGGVGKSALLQRFAQEADAAGRARILVDGRTTDPSPSGFTAALGARLDVAPDDAVDALVDADPVLLVDGYELLAPLDTWLRESLVPRLPARAVVVLAGRNPPTDGWRNDTAWNELLRVVALRDLRDADARALLEARGVAAEAHDQLLQVARGHPLALVLVSDVIAQRDGEAPISLDDNPAIIEALLERFLRQVPSDRHRHALRAAAHAGVATERLLRDVVDETAPAELFDWLLQLSFTEPVPGGVAVHDLVSDVLNAELRWRDPDAWTTLHLAVTRHLEARVGLASGPAQHRAMLDLLQLYRFHPITRRFFDWEQVRGRWLEPAATDDHGEILALVREYEGDRSADIAAFWLGRQPHAFSVFRGRVDGPPEGFVCHLILSERDRDGEEEADPVVAALWEHIGQHGPLRSDERVRVVRWWAANDAYQDIATHHLVSARCALDWVHTQGLAWSFVVLADVDFYEPIFRFIDFHRPDGLEVQVGDRCYGTFARDWRRTSRDQWRELLIERRTGTETAPQQLPTPPRLVVLAQDAFAAAVRAALKGMARPDGLEGNPLLRSRVVVDLVRDDRTATEVLTELLQEAGDELSAHPRDRKAGRALDLTYYRPAPTQEAAAERLDLPFSTFRRHLAAGIEHVTDWLWERELHGHG